MFRTRFKKEIVCEFLPPFRKEVPSPRGGGFNSRAQKPAKVIILAHGMPGAPKAKEVMEFWSKKGFWVFFPRYRGTWESGGEFLKHSPEKDILDVIDELPKGFKDLWTGNSYKLSAKSYKLFIFGGSFGGPAAILCSRDPRVTKSVAFAPVIDWEAPSDEPMGELGAFLPIGFGNSYRFSKKNWNRLSRNEFYSPVSLLLPPPFLRGSAESSRRGGRNFDGKKLLIFHAQDDTCVPYSYTKKFTEKVGAKLITLRTGGHFGFNKSIEPKVYKEIKKFLKNQ
ncbi:MAG: prolyl oligopeptidase family serine peptidase [bacterium]|nr:prolyl oligopeptidase family serine peptidase [bacterium]